jgi:hypothetical protein
LVSAAFLGLLGSKGEKVVEPDISIFYYHSDDLLDVDMEGKRV